MRYDVALAACKSYEDAEVSAALETAVTAAGGLDWVTPGMRVALKLNLVSAMKPEEAATVHPAVVCALVRMLQARGAHVVLGDSPGGLYNAAHLQRVYDVTGLRAAEALGADCVLVSWGHNDLKRLESAGLPVALSRTVAASPESERLPILRSSLRLFCVAGGVGTAVLLLFAGGISELAGSAPSKLAVMALAPTTLFVAVESAYRGYFQGKADMTPPAVSQAVDAVTKLVLGTAAAWYLYRAGYPAEVVAAGAILGVTVGTLVSAAVLVVSARGEYRRAGGKRGKPIRLHGIKRRLLRLAFPLTVGALFLSMVNTVDAMTATVELQDKIIAYRLKNGQAEAAYLTVDRLNDGNRFIVKEGLSVGDTIVAEGVGLVREGMSITPKNETK